MPDEPLLHYDEAADLVHVSVDVVKQWKSRHRLHPAGWDGHRPLFRVADVLAADEKARNEPGGRKRKSA